MKTTRAVHAVAAIEDHRAATTALMEVNRQLTSAVTACRAIAHDARNINDPQVKAAARRLLRIVDGMKAGPNVAVWDELATIEKGARAALQSAA